MGVDTMEERVQIQKGPAGIFAGLAGGIVFGILMQALTTTTEAGTRVPLMTLVANIVGSDSVGVGWIYHLFNSAVIGGLFGWILGGRVGGYGSAVGWGAGYGFAWWILGALILMPVLLGMPAFAPLQMPMMRPVALTSLIGHLMFGVLLGAAFVPFRGTAGHAPLGSARHA